MKAEDMTRIRMVMKDRVQAAASSSPISPADVWEEIVDIVIASDIYICRH